MHIARPYGLAPSVSTQQMRDVTCLRTNRTETARPAGLDWRSLTDIIQRDKQTNYLPYHAPIVIGEQTD